MKLAGSVHRREDNIGMNLKGIAFADVDGFMDRVQWWPFVNKVMHCWVPKKVTLLTSILTNSYLRVNIV
jgi:hypothetical protein